uniref:Matrix protein n=1 Tax=Viral hemorrhagic septicemia virus TaxID=11287 RepID=I7GSM3_9RHAB|nr:matrix protein [Viral hemorrhagic septicemia virus]QCQ77544.1 matrix protein [Viral hemorrhagic septicemia virus]QCQ77550.1 matrix protein [Viral hemorrhagic septicemia virus]QCQ77562.1 matrix protein [Viral hemorrhagic septicemia virus]QCQ77568.1 matrix protein [Viral hemorrhagic septicemia virus]
MALFKRKRIILVPPPHLTSNDEDRVSTILTEGTLTITGPPPGNQVDKICMAMKLARAILCEDQHPAFNPLVHLFQSAMIFGETSEKIDFGTRSKTLITSFKIAEAKAIYLDSSPVRSRIEAKKYTTPIRHGSVTYYGPFVFADDHVGGKGHREKLGALCGFLQSGSYGQAKDYYNRAVEEEMGIPPRDPKRRSGAPSVRPR